MNAPEMEWNLNDLCLICHSRNGKNNYQFQATHKHYTENKTAYTKLWPLTSQLC